MLKVIEIIFISLGMISEKLKISLERKNKKTLLIMKIVIKDRIVCDLCSDTFLSLQ